MPDYTLKGEIPEGCHFKRLELDNIEATAATQIRLRLDQAVVEQYTEDMRNGSRFPPLDVFAEPNSERYILADGFHRHRAAINAGWEDMGCIIHPGGMHEALVYALGANHDHGLRLSNADKRNAVQVALKDPQLSELSLREIADICRVSHMTVARLRNDMNLGPDDEPGKEQHNPDKKKPKQPTDEDRKVKREATQEQVDTRELKDALKAVMALPYSGTDALERTVIDADLIADAEYVSAWCADLVLAYRKAKRS